MRLGLGFITLLLTLLTALESLACSCSDFANAQQAAQLENVIVAKVETLILSEGKARVRVEKVFKGEIKNVYLNIQGQDGLNCNGENLPVGAKGVLLFTSTDEGYQTLSCATTSIPLTPNGKYQLFLGEEFLLSERELKDVLNFKLQASVKSIECRLNVSRMAVPYDSAPLLNFQYDTSLLAVPTPDTTTTLTTTVDLSAQTPNIGELFFYAEVSKAGTSNYDFSLSLKDPFTQLLANRFTYLLDIRKTLQFEGPSLTRFTDLAGNPMVDSNQPFLAHQTQAFCALNLGHPLEVVK